METAGIRRRLREEIGRLKIVDTHEHLEPEASRLKRKIDFGNLWGHYASSDLIAAGMAQTDLEFLRDANQPLMERWAKLAPFWPHVRTTAYGRTLLLAARDLYGASDINENTVEDLSEKIEESNREGWFLEVLRNRAGIATIIQDGWFDEADRSICNPVIHHDELITPRSRGELEGIGARWGIAIHSLDDLCAAVDAAFTRDLNAGACGVKSALAYSRILRYDKATRAEAESVFARCFEAHGEGVSWQEAKPLQDFMMHQTIRAAAARDLTFQFHTGLHEGNGNTIGNSNPTHLSNLFLEYREVRFDLFHGSYPYGGELATLAKNFPNVYIDMCWLHVISPTYARRWLREWLETVPSNKISAFGGDYIFIEGAYAHAMMARDGVADCLADMVGDGYFSEDEAHDVARKVLRDNPNALFRLGLDDKRKRVASKAKKTSKSRTK